MNLEEGVSKQAVVEKGLTKKGNKSDFELSQSMSLS